MSTSVSNSRPAALVRARSPAAAVVRVAPTAAVFRVLEVDPGAFRTRGAIGDYASIRAWKLRKPG